MNAKTALVIGVGGLGCTSASLLARHGINLILIDGDVVEKSNLDRQILFYKNDVGKPKVECAKNKLEEFTKVNIIFDNFNKNSINKYKKLFKDIDIIIDCTDNLETREIINKFSFKNLIPWIYSAGVKDYGTVYFIDPNNKERACYNCFNLNKQGESACDVGVLNTTVSIIGAMSARMAVEYLETNKYENDMIRLKENLLYKLKIKRNRECNHN